ncbi:hypothetical protein TIFTF001_034306 [Ficus carica]|uniref:Uncharacterized protein n=1 Tax=Ficus carica TaxID=3494 RepID=A0AA88J4Z5_FICCA|nr:hypothetical protein TIFTF001_034306 [Ficus carica]
MESDRATQMSLKPSGLSSFAVQDYAILQRVLGMRQGHMARVGPILSRHFFILGIPVGVLVVGATFNGVSILD